jgi:hypothetical protein
MRINQHSQCHWGRDEFIDYAPRDADGQKPDNQ